MQENTPPLFVAKTQCSHPLRRLRLTTAAGDHSAVGFVAPLTETSNLRTFFAFTTWTPCMRSKIRFSIWLIRWYLQCDLATKGWLTELDACKQFTMARWLFYTRTQLVYWIITWLSKSSSGLWNWRHWRTTACIKVSMYINIYIYM